MILSVDGGAEMAQRGTLLAQWVQFAIKTGIPKTDFYVPRRTFWSIFFLQKNHEIQNFIRASSEKFLAAVLKVDFCVSRGTFWANLSLYLSQITRPELAIHRRKKSACWVDGFPFVIYYKKKLKWPKYNQDKEEWHPKQLSWTSVNACRVWSCTNFGTRSEHLKDLSLTFSAKWSPDPLHSCNFLQFGHFFCLFLIGF